MINVLQSYLVSLGFHVESHSFDTAKNAMNKAEDLTRHFGSTAVQQFAIASTGLSTFVITAGIGMAKFVQSLAMADLKQEMFARKMWTTKENAAALNYTLEAMGATIEDLYLSPELATKFTQLREQAFSMAPPPEYAEQMKFIRSIIFEFQRLKLTATYALQWIGSYLIKYLEEPLKRFKINFTSFNDLLQKTMPIWTRKIAEVLSWVARLGLAAITAGRAIIDLFQQLPKSVGIATGAFAAFFTLLKMGPIGWIITGLTAILLLIDDYQTAMSGGKSAYGDFWKSMKEGNLFGGIGDEFKDITLTLADTIKAFSDLAIQTGIAMDNFAKFIGYKDFGDFMRDVVVYWLQKADDLLKSFNAGMETLTNFSRGDFSGAADKAAEAYSRWIDMKMGKDFVPNTKGILENLPSGLVPDYSKYTAPPIPAGSQSMNQTNTINIYGAEKPHESGQAVEQTLYGLEMRNSQGMA